jgi:hypothetical protein
METLLSIYSIVSAERCTPQSILRFLSLLSPVEEGTVSQNEPLFSTFLNDVVIDSLKQPESVFPLNGEAREGRTLRNFQGSTTVLFSRFGFILNRMHRNIDRIYPQLTLIKQLWSKLLCL